LIKNIQLNRNVNSENSYKFFEISNVFGDNLSRVLTCVAHGDKHDENWAAKKRKYDKFDMTSIVEDIAKIFGLKKSDLIYEIKEIVDNKLMYITLSLSIDKLIDKIKNNSKEKFIDYSKLPYIRRDLSFFIDVNITYDSILRFIEKTNVHSLKKILLFDLYIGKNVPKEKKSLGMGFIFQEDTKTLTHKEADIYIEEIVEGLKEEFKIELRE
jgi:phenylalanyl-tRNA synthetase beta subunit